MAAMEKMCGVLGKRRGEYETVKRRQEGGVPAESSEEEHV